VRPTQPRVFFGTMFSGENELDMCLRAVSQQRFLKSKTHYLIAGKKEVEAHNELWQEWTRVKSDYDLFVKVDADTVLKDEMIISDVWSLFKGSERVTGVQLKLHDYFTDSLISGLNFFSPQVVFSQSRGLFADRVDTNHDVVLKGESVSHLDPGGYHCPAPSNKQAFHFGLHRSLKRQTDVIRKTFDAWKKNPESVGRLYAILGPISVIERPHLNENYDYSCPEFCAAFESMSALNEHERVSKVIDYSKAMNWL
jgi:hypothetical protein